MKKLTGFYITIGAITLMCYCSISYKEYLNNQRILKATETKSCECVTYSQYALWQAKYDMYVDKNKPDSVAKYAELLNQIK